jgi:AcrR family transcriptional regulator
VDERPYHHGTLRRVILDAALEDIAEHGAAALSLRALARRAGVSHAAPAHHFGDRAGLLTAVATEGFSLLADALEAARTGSGTFLDVGLAYVRFAIDHPAHFAVMFEPSLYRPESEDVARERRRAARALYGSAGTMGEGAHATLTALAGWSLVHGFATLWRSGALPRQDDDPIATARAIALAAFRGPGGGVSAGATPRGRRKTSG